MGLMKFGLESEGLAMSLVKQERVIVPVDFSDDSLAAVDKALELVEQESQLVVLHVLPVLTVMEPGVIWDTIDDAGRIQHARRALTERLAHHPDVQIHVVVGDPGREIADFAQQEEAALIVMPSHGRTGMERLLLGSVAERVLRLARCPVLVLKQ